MDIDVKYETGVVWQDFQHKQLMDLFGKIKAAKKNKKEKNLFRYTVAFLAMYANHHFKLEEEYMENYNYPDTDIHQKEHKSFVKELKSFRAENKEFSEAAADDITTRMGEWILSHILENDQKLGTFILEKEQPDFKKD